MESENLARTFNFRITLNASNGSSPSLGDGGFQECLGLEVEMDVQELIEGGRNDGVVRRVGRGKYTNIVLKRGMLYPDRGHSEQRLVGMDARGPEWRPAGGALRRHD